MSRLHMPAGARARGLVQIGALLFGGLVAFVAGADVSAQSPSKTNAAAAAPQTSKLSKGPHTAQVRQQVVSPYARAAAQRTHAGRSPALGQTTLQAVQNSHKPHGTPPK